MRTNLNKIFWGLIFISLNINIPIDILPDFVGYILIFNGLDCILLDDTLKVDKMKKAFSIGLIPCRIMVIVEVIKFIASFYIGDYGIMHSHIYSAFISITGVFYMVIIFSICNGMYEAYENLGENELSKKIRSTCYVYIVLLIADSLVSPMNINLDIFGNENNNGIYILISIAFLILIFKIILQLRSLRNRY